MSDRRCESIRGPLAPYALGFQVELDRLGYARGSVTRHLSWMACLSGWLAERDLAAGVVGGPELGAFLASGPESGSARRPVTALAFAPLLGHLRCLGVVAEPVKEPARGLLGEQLERYRAYLADERNLGAATINGYLPVARLFLSPFLDGDEGDLAGLTSAQVTGFLRRECPGRSATSARGLVSILRSLLRFLYLEGTVTGPLAQAVPSATGWAASALPRALGRGQTDQLLASCDHGRYRGLRDFAILTVLIRLALRAGEVAAIDVEDLDWRAGEITVHGKGGREDRLPLPVDVGESVVAYLQRGRPRGRGGPLFLREHAPFHGLTSAGISQVVQDAGRRAGVPGVGAHQLRHTAATDLLRAGAPLSEIAELLRHDREATTAIYAKVDHDALFALALPWPGGAR